MSIRWSRSDRNKPAAARVPAAVAAVAIASADLDITETAKAAEFFRVDGVIVSGISTGQPADPAEVASVSSTVGIPTLVGSGVTPENLGTYRDADAVIVGSWIKRDGVWSNPLDERRVRIMAEAFGVVRA